MIIKIPLMCRSKKNSQRIIVNSRTRRPMIIQSELYKDFEQKCGLFLNKYKTNIDYPIISKRRFMCQINEKET